MVLNPETPRQKYQPTILIWVDFYPHLRNKADLVFHPNSLTLQRRAACFNTQHGIDTAHKQVVLIQDTPAV